MTLLDAYALVALVADEPAAADVETLLRAGDSRVIATNLAEAIDVSQRVHGYPLEDVREALEPLILAGDLEVVLSGEEEAWLAAELRARHYDPKRRPLSLADCFLVAHGMTGEAVATPDPHLAEAARAEAVEVIGLPDSNGERA